MKLQVLYFYCFILQLILRFLHLVILLIINSIVLNNVDSISKTIS